MQAAVVVSSREGGRVLQAKNVGCFEAQRNVCFESRPIAPLVRGLGATAVCVCAYLSPLLLLLFPSLSNLPVLSLTTAPPQKV
ncbi:hypothetical protein CC86DRAFT_374550 [Ophiobolus disseminans]|uniref:Uncharacterized protein n=1 Tax=Ophiobolus disseminans TaxID=1469910 RepID=A0A6A6ZJB6_9PLEO|nr:hypothetical protein CC86DRAFT_374550 [Ophiobolus disseminans]